MYTAPPTVSTEAAPIPPFSSVARTGSRLSHSSRVSCTVASRSWVAG